MSPTHPQRAENGNELSMLLGLLAVLLLYAKEGIHYKHTLVGTREHYFVRDLDNHPGCVERNGNPRELTCPLPGYNTVRLGCLTSQCTYEDQDSPEITPKVLADYRARQMAEFGVMPEPKQTWDQNP